jgi:hypothetical protein
MVQHQKHFPVLKGTGARHVLARTKFADRARLSPLFGFRIRWYEIVRSLMVEVYRVLGYCASGPSSDSTRCDGLFGLACDSPWSSCRT